jgi:large subunit ribosomal protein L28
MGMQCEVCGKKPVVGNKRTYRGKAKYLGGVGRKPTGISKRLFKPNLQTIQCQVGGGVQTMRVCVKCIRAGRVQRPVKKKAFSMPTPATL